jgi:dynein heavy chain
MYIKIGDKDVEYSKNFKLFLHTKLSKPHYPPEIQAETTLINFAVTEQVSDSIHHDRSADTAVQHPCW